MVHRSEIGVVVGGGVDRITRPSHEAPGPLDDQLHAAGVVAEPLEVGVGGGTERPVQPGKADVVVERRRIDGVDQQLSLGRSTVEVLGVQCQRGPAGEAAAMVVAGAVLMCHGCGRIGRERSDRHPRGPVLHVRVSCAPRRPSRNRGEFGTAEPAYSSRLKFAGEVTDQTLIEAATVAGSR